MKSIVIYYGNQKSESYNLEQFQKEVVSFGRQPDNDIVLDLEFVSRIHGVFYMEEGIWYVQDLNSTNGILVNGNRVQLYIRQSFILQMIPLHCIFRLLRGWRMEGTSYIFLTKILLHRNRCFRRQLNFI